MDISIILCTYNRVHNLTECIGRISSQLGVDDVDWELVVVDNNSTDGTSELVMELQNNHAIKIRYFFEPMQGLNHARNRGITSTESRYLVYIDDDILVEPYWLKAIWTALKENECDAVGGRIWIKSPNELPRWIKEDMRGFLGHNDYGEFPLRMDGRKFFPFGGNMAFDRRIFYRIGLFDIRRGRVGEGRKRKELTKGGETELFERMADAGGKMYYTPDAIVYHKILPHQLKKQYFRQLHFNAGYQEALLSNENYTRRLYGIPLFLFRNTIKEMFKYVEEIVLRGPNFAFRQQMTVGYAIGSMIAYSIKNRKSKNPLN